MRRRTALSRRELRRLEVLRQLESGTVTSIEAARLLDLSQRQFRRLRAAYLAGGAAALAHGNRGRRPSNATDPGVASQVLELAASYQGLTLTRLAAALAEHHGIHVSRATLHRILRRAASVESAARACGAEPGDGDQ